MKAVLIKKEEVKKFNPFKIEITIENQDDALEVLHRVNPRMEQIKNIENYNSRMFFPADGNSLDIVYGLVTSELQNQGVKYSEGVK